MSECGCHTEESVNQMKRMASIGLENEIKAHYNTIKERDKLLSLLATERDAFGKRETELLAELKSFKKPCTEHHDGGCLDCLEADHDRWREIGKKLTERGRNIEDILQVPEILGASSSATCQKAIDEFRESLSAYESALKEGL